ncbi:hypothetical protein ACPZ19_41000 [Amycolatopsis lurida]
MPSITRPAIVCPGDRLGLREVVEHYTARNQDHPRLADSVRVMKATGVRTRAFATPIDKLSDPELTVEERLDRHFGATCELAEQAAREALDNAGIARTDIDGLVCASTTGYTMPGLDVELTNRLGLPRDVTRVSATQMGCNGGSWALARAAELCAGPDIDNVLVVAADLFQSYIHPSDLGMDVMIFRALLGDAAGACVVRRAFATPGPDIDATWDYTVPGTSDIVGTRTGHDGIHIHNSPRLFDAVSEVTHELTLWLKQIHGASDARTEFLVAHPGGPRVMERLADGFGCDSALLDLSRQSLRELGNTGAASILDVLARTFVTPPQPGARGVAIGIGPGVTSTASHLVWR